MATRGLETAPAGVMAEAGFGALPAAFTTGGFGAEVPEPAGVRKRAVHRGHFKVEPPGMFSGIVTVDAHLGQRNCLADMAGPRVMDLFHHFYFVESTLAFLKLKMDENIMGIETSVCQQEYR